MHKIKKVVVGQASKEFDYIKRDILFVFISWKYKGPEVSEADPQRDKKFVNIIGKVPNLSSVLS